MNLDYLIELRRRLIYSLVFIGVIFIPLAFYAQQLYQLLAKPITHNMIAQTGLIATQVAAPFLAPFKFAVICALFIGMPFLLYQLWAFIAPALYAQEKKLIWPLLIISTILFYLGVCLAYFLVLPLVIHFFMQVAPTGVEVKPDINHYLDFSLKLFFAFGFAFEVPVITWLLIKCGVVTQEQMANKRPYIIVGAFIAGMLLTPPDVISQILLSIPIWLLFELGLLFSKYIE